MVFQKLNDLLVIVFLTLTTLFVLRCKILLEIADFLLYLIDLLSQSKITQQNTS